MFANAKSDERPQYPGWVLRELSLANLQAVIEFCELNLHLLSREGLKYMVEKMPDPDAKRLLERHAKKPRASTKGR